MDLAIARFGRFEFDPGAFKLRKDGVAVAVEPKAGKGSWRLVRLVQPERTLLPADLPAEEPPVGDDGVAAEVRTPGDKLRPRWGSGYDPTRELFRWKDGVDCRVGIRRSRGQARSGTEYG